MTYLFTFLFFHLKLLNVNRKQILFLKIFAITYTVERISHSMKLRILVNQLIQR